MSSDENSVLMALLQEMQKTNASMLQEMQTMNASMQTMTAILQRPAQIASGKYYSCITDVWNFQLKECKGDFSTADATKGFQGKCPEYLGPVFKNKILSEYSDLVVDDNDQLVAAKSTYVEEANNEKAQHIATASHSLTSPNATSSMALVVEGKVGTPEANLCQHQDKTPIRTNSSMKGVKPVARKSSSTESSLQSSVSTLESSKGTATTNKGQNNEAKSKEHIFGGRKNTSEAHLFPPQSPVCQEFYENTLPCICGPLESVPYFNSLVKHKKHRKAVMTLVRAIADCNQNKITLPEDHAPYFDNEMTKGTLLVIPILTTKDALQWEKDQAYSVLVIADSISTYRWCDIDPLKNVTTASSEDIKLATAFVTDCVCSLGYSLLEHTFEPLANRGREDRFDKEKKADDSGRREAAKKKKDEQEKLAKVFRQASFDAKVGATETLKKLIVASKKVLAPVPKNENYNDLRILKINLGESPDCRTPHPTPLGMKAAICLHKFAAKEHAHMYQTSTLEDVNIKDYIQEKGSMMLLPGCGPVLDEDAKVFDMTSDTCDSIETDFSESSSFSRGSSSMPTTPPRVITVVRTVTPECEAATSKTKEA